MPLSEDEFTKASCGPNTLEEMLRANPGRAYSLSELEEMIIGKEMNRKKHLDVFIADFALLAPLIFELEKIRCKKVNGITYFMWAG
jgi:hypothetical protein